MAFRKLLPLSERFLSQQEYIDHPIKYDVHLVGSDQVWNVEGRLDNAFSFYLFWIALINVYLLLLVSVIWKLQEINVRR